MISRGNHHAVSSTDDKTQDDNNVMKAGVKHKSFKKQPTYYGCKKKSHYAKQCPNLYCSHCDMKGHSLNNCKKRNYTSETAKLLTIANEHSFAFKAATVEQIMLILVPRPILLEFEASSFSLIIVLCRRTYYRACRWL